MGQDKAAIRLEGVPLIERVYQAVEPLATSLVQVGGVPYLEHLGVQTVPDRYPDGNALGGIATALVYAVDLMGTDTWVLCVACDMPFLQPALLRLLLTLRDGVQLVVPHSGYGHEPLCALYHTSVLPACEAELARSNLRIPDVFPHVRTRVVPAVELRAADPALRSFVNVNCPRELQALAGG